MTKKKKKKGNGTKVILNILLILSTCVLVFCIYKLGSIWWEYHANRETQEQVQNLFYGQTDTEQAELSGSEGSTPVLEQEYIFDLTPVIQQNPDTVGWIQIPGTVIDYVVLQGEDNDQYLHTGFYGEANNAGSIFMDYQNQLGAPMQNLILYGHRMKDNSMFGQLGEYLDYSFYQQHPSFVFITADGVYDCHVFSVYQCTTSVDYGQPYFVSEEDMQQYIQEAKDRSVYRTAVSVSVQDTIMTLSTCDYALDPDEGRLVIHAKLQLRGKA